MVIKEVLSQRKSIKEFNENKLRKVGHVPHIAHRLKTVLYCVKEVADMVVKDKTCSRSACQLLFISSCEIFTYVVELDCHLCC